MEHADGLAVVPPPSASGQPELVLPGFVDRQADGVFIDTRKLLVADDLARIVERIFSSGFFLAGVDYPLFERLLYDYDAVRGQGRLRLAAEIREFPAARRALYKGVKIVGGEAQYIFEPVVLESTVDEPVYDTGEDGERRVVGSERRVIAEKAKLDADEFVADMWTKGVRFGIDIAAVRQVIDEERCERLVIARDQPPTPGKDAGIEEQTPELHRDDAPREMPNGRLDLRQFKNRFPQMRQGTLLLRKQPRTLGEPGHAVSGALLEPPLPKDFDLATLAGEGTCLEHRDGCEYIVAAMDGFLNIDTKTNRISITEKIINREGVSARTTGNLSLAGDHYEEFGEVQEGRVVEGKNLTFHADVFGKALSLGGRILVEQNLVGGTAISQEGEIVVAGLASGAVAQALHGTVRVKRAENAVLVGDKVEVEWATNSTILADEVKVDVAEGCAIAGKRIQIGMARPRGREDTLVSVLLPDLSGMDRQLERERAVVAECEKIIARLQPAADKLAADPDVQRYLAVAARVQRKEISLNADQQAQFQHLRARLNPSLKRITQVREEIRSQEVEIGEARRRMTELEAERKAAAASLDCRIESVQGDIEVRTLVEAQDAVPLRKLAARDLKIRLRTPDPGSRMLFSGSSGRFEWKPPAASDEAAPVPEKPLDL